MKKNILITCAGGSGALYLAKTMKRKHNIFLVDGSDQTVAPLLGFPFKKIPFGNHPKYLQTIKKLVKKWQINCIVPGADEELLPISKLCKQNSQVVAILPSADFITLCLNKKKLMQALDKSDISHLPPFKKNQVIYPAIAKPIHGRGSRQVHQVNSKKELDGYLKLFSKKFSRVLVHPYISGKEYTVSVIVNNLNKLISIIPKEVILKKGITKAAVVRKNNLINTICKKIVDRYKPSGPFNVQLKLFKNKVYIFEINPRLSTTSVLTDKAFGNEVELYLRYYNQVKISSLPQMKQGTFLYRYDKNIFVQKL